MSFSQTTHFYSFIKLHFIHCNKADDGRKAIFELKVSSECHLSSALYSNKMLSVTDNYCYDTRGNLNIWKSLYNERIARLTCR